MQHHWYFIWSYSSLDNLLYNLQFTSFIFLNAEFNVTNSKFAHVYRHSAAYYLYVLSLLSASILILDYSTTAAEPIDLYFMVTTTDYML